MLWMLAISGDLASLIPGFNIISTIFTATGMLVLSAGTKNSLFSGVGGLATGLVTVTELAPFLSGLPLWTVRVAMSSAAKEIMTPTAHGSRK